MSKAVGTNKKLKRRRNRGGDGVGEIRELTIFGLGAFMLGLGCGMGIIAYMTAFYVDFGIERHLIPLYRLAEETSIPYIIPLLITIGVGLIAYATIKSK